MLFKFLRRRWRWAKKRFGFKRLLVLVTIFIVSVTVIIYSMVMQPNRLSVDPKTYTPLLSVIGHAESNGNYNAYFGNANNTSVKFTDMTIAEVMKWQSNHVRQGNLSSAVGKYQIIDTTLSELVSKKGFDPNQKFNASTQDKLAIALIERRGGKDYVNRELTREQLANNLAKEWAGLPKVIGDKPGDSYYASDGINKSRVSVDQIIKAIEQVRAKK